MPSAAKARALVRRLRGKTKTVVRVASEISGSVQAPAGDAGGGDIDRTDDGGAVPPTSLASPQRPDVSENQPDHGNSSASDALDADSDQALWLEAQQSDEIKTHKLWPAFALHFHIVDGQPCTDALKTFAEAVDDGRGKLREVFDDTVTFLRDNREAGTAITSIDPTKAASVAWGCAQLFATIATNAGNMRNAAHNQDAVSKIKDRCTAYASVYLTSSLPAATRGSVRSKLIRLYIDIIKYVMRCWNYVQGGKLGHVTQALTSSSAVEDALQQVRWAERDFRVAMAAADSRTTVDLHALVKVTSEKFTTLLEPLQTVLTNSSDVNRTMAAGERRDLLRWVSDASEGARLQEILEKHMSGTGQWFTSHQAFQQMQRSGCSSSLWLTGPMGTGKSDVMAQAVAQLCAFKSDNHTSRPLAYYFCDKTNKTRATELDDAAQILRCLLKQLLQCPGHAVIDRISQVFEQRRLDGRKLTASEARDLLIEICNQLGHVSIFVDAVDECGRGVRTNVIMDLSDIQQKSGGTLNVVIASRDEPDLSQCMRNFNDLSRLSMQSGEDVSTYIKTRLEQDFARGLLMAELKPFALEIERTLTAKASGMFRWAVSALAFIERPSLDVPTALNRLEKLPPDLFGLYNAMYEKLKTTHADHFEVIKDTLLLILHQRVSLTPTEISEAVLRWSHSRAEVSLMQTCADFLELEHETRHPQFKHASVLEFFETHEDFRSGHARIATLCLAPLKTIIDTKNGLTLYSMASNDHPSFLDYAICNLPWHATHIARGEAVAEITMTLSDVRKICLSTPDLVAWLDKISRLIESRASRSPTASLLDETASASLSVGVGSIEPTGLSLRRTSGSMSSLISVGSGTSKNFRAPSDGYPASPSEGESSFKMPSLSAMGIGNNAPLETRRERKLQSSHTSSLCSAVCESSCGSEDSVDSSISHTRTGCDSDLVSHDHKLVSDDYELEADTLSVCSEPANLLFGIAKWGLVSLLQLRLDRPLRWSQLNVLGQPPMIVGMQSLKSAFPRMLAEVPREAIHAKTRSGKVLLHSLCEADELALARKVLNCGGDPNTMDAARRTPLHAAIGNCNPIMVQQLVEYGARLTKVGRVDLDNAWLSLASRIVDANKVELVKVLSTMEALAYEDVALELFTHTVHGYTLLHVAATCKHVSIVEFLLSHGVDVHRSTPQREMQTALHIAANGIYPETVEALKAGGADVLATDEKLRLPIHCASSGAIAKQLLRSTQSPRDITVEMNFARYRHVLLLKDGMDRNAVEAAIARGATTAVAILLVILRRHDYTLSHWSPCFGLEELTPNQLRCEHYCRKEGALFLPYNISSDMTRTLVGADVVPCVSIKADPPADVRLARLAEKRWAAESNSEDGVSSGAHWDNDCVDPCSGLIDLDPDSEQAIREQRIEEDEQTNANFLRFKEEVMKRIRRRKT